MNKKECIAIFDFDNTITTTDTFRDFFGWNFGYFRVAFIHFIFFPLVFLGFISPVFLNAFKKILIKLFLGNISADSYKAMCSRYASERLKYIIKENAKNKIYWHKSQGHKIIIVSASLKDWIQFWADEFSFDRVFAAEPEIQNSILTGFISEEFYYGANKLKALKELAVNRMNSTLYCYGDSKSDRYILEAATFPFYKNF